ncbi:uncharacterized protein LOC125532023 [Triticum urartu]|uniref:uncharacterized protein LOC125532023 n=1 Tax=Triticum urartu TaxID=4572 RepID=UPI00204444AA|nr:uncharacterized protein LOC125532023 [Triticum urartu]
MDIFECKMTILTATPQGRILIQTLMAVVSECHSRNKTWNGEFEHKHIRIITTRQSKKFIMILKDPVKLEGEALLQAMLNDLRTAAAILIPLYRTNNDLPVGFFELQDDLEGATRHLVSQPRFLEYLRYHPAIMSSAGRSKFAKALSSRPTYRDRILGAITGPYHNDWRTVVNSEMRDNTAIDVLTAVYHHKPGTSYGRTMGELARFIRNVLVHGKEHKRQDGVVIYYDEHDLEMYLFKIFTPFLPSIMRTLLISGNMVMEQLYGDAWPSYKLYV